MILASHGRGCLCSQAADAHACVRLEYVFPPGGAILSFSTLFGSLKLEHVDDVARYGKDIVLSVPSFGSVRLKPSRLYLLLPGTRTFSTLVRVG